ncbi:hypothetical protein G4G27_10980 [Sphingomonas sp. So64.6b]|uniref:hypothetical protein n=1 Tax=Sphingomonas sp. So64.6b TaxID=2997354 RepID=UPI001601D6B5|nr:hypothetical protein [Sphingomonas sp. So64.6b]QNA84455.1 hypothetical protein G4G27_10980 [Sphingomonas sp. So64.6b]
MTDEQEHQHDDSGECIIPPELPKTELRNLVVEQSEHEVREITDYIEWQCNKMREREIENTGESDIEEELVEHAEKLKTERVFGTDYRVWDVHTNLNRWWVITNPTNLYSQKLMPSVDYTLSFHIGLMARVQARREPEGDEVVLQLLSITQRKIHQAALALDAANEIEDFQAIGLQCREAMTSFIKEVNAAGLFDEIADAPKKGDFTAWSDHVIGAKAAGGAAEYVRGYLKAICQKGWQLANWLTHAGNATRADAELALSATEHVLQELTGLALKSLARAPDRCGRCGSFDITVTWRPDEGEMGEYIAECGMCGAEGRRGSDQDEPNAVSGTVVPDE